MKKFAFTLQRMLAFKTTMYEKERNALAQLRAERLTVEQRRDNILLQMAQADAEYRRKAAEGGIPAEEVRQLALKKQSSDALVEMLEAEMARLDVEIERQLQVVIELDREVKSLEKLREAQWAEWQEEYTREEKERILELVSRRYVDDQAAQAEEDSAS